MNLPYSDFRKGLISWEDFKGKLNLSEIKTAFSDVTTPTMANLFSKMESQNLRVDSIFLNYKTYSSIRKWGRDVFNIESKADLLREGLMGYLWGTQLLAIKSIPDSIIIALSEEESKIGVILNLGREKELKLENIEPLMKKMDNLHNELNRTFKNIKEIIQEKIDEIEKK